MTLPSTTSPVTRPVPPGNDAREEPIRIVIADDNATVRGDLRAHLAAQAGLDVVGEAADGEQACASARALRPAVLLLDLSMPGMSGLEAAERIGEDCPDVRIIVLTMHEERSYVVRLMRAGAMGYVLKRTAGTSLLPAILAVVSGASYVDPAVPGAAERDAAVAAADGVPDEHDALTGREAALLRLVALGQSNAEIATALGLSADAVALERGSGMTKLGLRSRAALMRHAAERGWLES